MDRTIITLLLSQFIVFSWGIDQIDGRIITTRNDALSNNNVFIDSARTSEDFILGNKRNDSGSRTRKLNDPFILEIDSSASSSADDEYISASGIKWRSKEEKCIPSGRCKLCDRSGLEGCEKTGKRQKHTCRFESYTPRGNIFKSKQEHKSCTRTDWDENITMIRLQLVCLFIAIVSMLSVRKEKSANASLFEQRGNLKRTHIENVELVPLTQDADKEAQGEDEGNSRNESLADEMLSLCSGEKSIGSKV